MPTFKREQTHSSTQTEDWIRAIEETINGISESLWNAEMEELRTGRPVHRLPGPCWVIQEGDLHEAAAWLARNQVMEFALQDPRYERILAFHQGRASRKRRRPMEFEKWMAEALACEAPKTPAAGPRFPGLTRCNQVSVVVYAENMIVEWAAQRREVAREEFAPGRKPGDFSAGWTMLATFAEKKGYLQDASGKKKKRISLLRKRLRSFFGLQEDPLPFELGAYRARFPIRLYGRQGR